MTYSTTIPQPNDDLDVSVTDIQQNFLTANTVMDIDHYPFNNLTATKGQHKQVQIVNQAAIPPGLANGAETIYSKNIPSGGELFFTRGSSGVEIQLTGPGDTSATLQGHSFLPGGLLIQWGEIINPGSGSTPVTFPTPFPSGSAPFSITLTVRRNATSNAIVYYVDEATPPTSTGFNYVGTTSGSQFLYWMAIGK